ncbi:Flavoprotein [Sinosporangium album]|uniref:Flavoprotein n=1 Tax=Sinosporangium album TaxID=504805 RepID=A0A1G8BSR6_9ACTN|nr:flavoprotein [Sinosporangium album]SDH36247.1 Flavoprotein [Sinosporangium album]
MTETGSMLYIIVCATGAASEVGRLAHLAQNEGWHVQIIATPSAISFIDVPALEQQTGRPVRSSYREPSERRSPKADAIIVASASYNTINKFAQGIADTYALALLAEAPGLGIPIVILPFVNYAYASRAPFQRSVESLRAEGITVLLGPGQLEPHAPGTGGDTIDNYPWELALRKIQHHRMEKRV